MINRLQLLTKLNAEEPKHKTRMQITPPPDNDIHRFGELLDLIDCPVNTDDYVYSVSQA